MALLAIDLTHSAEGSQRTAVAETSATRHFLKIHWITINFFSSVSQSQPHGRPARPVPEPAEREEVRDQEMHVPEKML